MNLKELYLASVRQRFAYYKELGEKALDQIKEDGDLLLQPNEGSNSIATIIRHLSGNFLSRWTNFLTEDGEKPWRHRDREFDIRPSSRFELLQAWQEGWSCALTALGNLSPEDLEKTIYIRGESLSVVDAVNRQLAHCTYHVGQIVYLAKMFQNEAWRSLSIEKGKSEEFNTQMKRGNR